MSLVDTLIEIYPAASLKSDQFRRLKWHELRLKAWSPFEIQTIADAKRASMTAVCYA